MKPKFWTLIKLLYSSLIRPVLVKAVESSSTEIDDFVLGILDKVFDYEPGK